MMGLTQGVQVVPKDFWSQSPYLAAILAVVAACLYYMDRQSSRSSESQKERDDDLREYLEARDAILLQSVAGASEASKTNQRVLMDAVERNSKALEGMAKALGPVMTVLDIKSIYGLQESQTD